MNKLLSLLSLLLLFLYSNNTPCNEITASGRNLRNLETFTDEICRVGDTQPGYLCFAKSDDTGCEEKKCEEMDSSNCSRFTPTSNTEICKLNNDADQCIQTTRSCNEMVYPNCDSLHLKEHKNVWILMANAN